MAQMQDNCERRITDLLLCFVRSVLLVSMSYRISWGCDKQLFLSSSTMLFCYKMWPFAPAHFKSIIHVEWCFILGGLSPVNLTFCLT